MPLLFPSSSLSRGLAPEQGPRQKERRPELPGHSPPGTHPHLCAELGGGTGGSGRQAGRQQLSLTHSRGRNADGRLPCGHVSAPPTEVGAQVPSLWALGARQADDERRCRLTLSWPHPPLPPPVAGWSLTERDQRLERRLGLQANEWAASSLGAGGPPPIGLSPCGSRADTGKGWDSP